MTRRKPPCEHQPSKIGFQNRLDKRRWPPPSYTHDLSTCRRTSPPPVCVRESLEPLRHARLGVRREGRPPSHAPRGVREQLFLMFSHVFGTSGVTQPSRHAPRGVRQRLRPPPHAPAGTISEFRDSPKYRWMSPLRDGRPPDRPPTTPRPNALVERLTRHRRRQDCGATRARPRRLELATPKRSHIPLETMSTSRKDRAANVDAARCGDDAETRARSGAASARPHPLPRLTREP